MSKKLLSIITITGAVLALISATAAYAGPNDHYALSLGATPSTVSVGGTLFVGGTLTHTDKWGHNEGGTANKKVWLYRYDGWTCRGESLTPPLMLKTDGGGNYGVTDVVGMGFFTGMTPGMYSFRSFSVDETASSCETVTVTTKPTGNALKPHDSGAYTCYSIGGTPYSWPTAGQAEAALNAGNWLPSAVSGPGAFQVGSYHLVCGTPVPEATAGVEVNGNVPIAEFYADYNGVAYPASYVLGIGSLVGFYPIY